jgi:Protein of unknown function (DUF3038)
MVVRQNMNYWQQIIQLDRLPLALPALAAQIENFIGIYQTSYVRATTKCFETFSQAALASLAELFFRSNENGQQRLWIALLQRAHSTTTPPKPT